MSLSREGQIRKFVQDWASGMGLEGKCTATRISTPDSNIAISAVGVKHEEIDGGNDPFSGPERVRVLRWLNEHKDFMS